MRCAGYLCTGGGDKRLKVWDLRQMGSGASLNPVINVDGQDGVLFSLASADPLGESHLVLAGKAMQHPADHNPGDTSFTTHHTLSNL
jgi:hypothetical protein